MRVDLDALVLRVAFAFLLLAAFTSSWTGLALLGFKPVDLSLALAMLFAAPSMIQCWRLTRWVWVGAGAVALIAAVHVILPTTGLYLSGRYTLPDLLNGPTLADTARPPLAVAVQWLVALLFLPWIGTAICGGSSRLVSQVLVAWMSGAACSGIVALTDFTGLTSIGSTLTGFVSITDRQSGLASHVNNLGFSCAMAVPVAVYLLRRSPTLAASSLVCLVTGIVLSGSRGSQVGLVVTLLLTAAIAYDSRRRLVRLVWIILVSVLVALLVPLPLPRQFDLFRFSQQDALASDSDRSRVAAQAYADIRHNPIFGVGYEVLVQAHSVYLELLAAGGLLLFLGLMAYWAGALVAGVRLSRNSGDVVIGYATASFATWLSLGAIQNQLTDRYLYIPVMAICALSVPRVRWMRPSGQDERMAGRREQYVPDRALPEPDVD